jgi:hypothetical protein
MVLGHELLCEIYNIIDYTVFKISVKEIDIIKYFKYFFQDIHFVLYSRFVKFIQLCVLSNCEILTVDTLYIQGEYVIVLVK